MPLPAEKTAWPPAEHLPRYDRMKACDVWYGGDPWRLQGHYLGSVGPHAQVSTATGGKTVNSAFGWFWGGTDGSELTDKVHVPLAQDIATLSSELLFAQTPKFEVQYTLFNADGTPNEAQKAEVVKTQARLDELLEACGFDATLLAAAETSAVLGSVGLRIAWDKSKIGMPVISRVDADAVVPEYTFGQLTAVTFWRTFGDANVESSVVWYHLERHELGGIWHGLYKGTKGNLGKRMALTDLDATAPLNALVNVIGFMPTVAGATTAISVPNALPDPLDRRGNTGRSDFTPGVLMLFDAIDKVYSSLMRDIDDGKSRLLVADYMLESNGPGRGVDFDEMQHIFTKLKLQPPETGEIGIEQIQFTIRAEDHIRTIDYLAAKAVRSCGYNPDSDNADDGGDMTATEYSGKQKRSMTTRSKKLRYFRAIEKLLFGLLQIDAAYFASGITPLPVKMIAPPGVQPGLKELAETAGLMKAAEASTIELRVKTMFPDLSQDEVDEIVEQYQEENSVVDPNTFGLPGNPAKAGGPLPPVDEDEPVDPDAPPVP